MSPATPDHPEDTKIVPPQQPEQRGRLHDVVLPVAQPRLIGGAGGAAAAYVTRKLIAPKDPPAEK